MIKGVLRYLKESQNTGMVYQQFPNHSKIGEFVGYTDAEWAGSSCRKSTSHSTLIYKNCLIAWKSRKKGLVTLSSTEAEMMALFDFYKENKAVRKLFEECGYVKKPWKKYTDNRACI